MQVTLPLFRGYRKDNVKWLIARIVLKKTPIGSNIELEWILFNCIKLDFTGMSLGDKAWPVFSWGQMGKVTYISILIFVSRQSYIYLVASHSRSIETMDREM